MAEPRSEAEVIEKYKQMRQELGALSEKINELEAKVHHGAAPCCSGHCRHALSTGLCNATKTILRLDAARSSGRSITQHASPISMHGRHPQSAHIYVGAGRHRSTRWC